MSQRCGSITACSLARFSESPVPSRLSLQANRLGNLLLKPKNKQLFRLPAISLFNLSYYIRYLKSLRKSFFPVFIPFFASRTELRFCNGPAGFCRSALIRAPNKADLPSGSAHSALRSSFVFVFFFSRSLTFTQIPYQELCLFFGTIGIR